MSDPVRDENSLVVATHGGDVQLGTLHASTPGALVAGASLMATTLAGVIDSQKLYSMIQGRKHVRVEGWTTLAVMLGCTAREVSNEAQEDGSFVATVELVRMSDGVVIARATAECGMDEPTWASRARYARRSMAATRATGKACRLAFSWIMALAGYDPTPLEEMPGDEPPRDVTPRTTRAKQTVAEVFNAPAEKPASAKISEAQRNRLFAIAGDLGRTAGLKEDQIRSEVVAIIGKYGYASTADIHKPNYDAIVDEVSKVLRGYAEPSDDAKAAAEDLF